MKKIFIMLFSIQMLFATLVPEIKKGNSIEGSIERGGKEYYRVEIKTWEDVRITLTDLSADISLYVKTDDDPREEVLPRIRENDCASTNLNTEDEECQYQVVIPEKSSSVDKSTSVYIMVYGLEAGDYTLTVTEEKHSTECITIDALRKAVNNGIDVTKVNTSCITDMSYLFANNSSFNQDISKWVVSNVANMDSMFKNAINFTNHDLSEWDVANVVTKEHFADGVGAGNVAPRFKEVTTTTTTTTECITRDELIKAIKYGQDVKNVNTSCIKDMSYLFMYNKSFNQDISSWDVSNVTNMNAMFYDAAVFNQDISSWDVSNVENMDYMFYGTSNFSNHDLSGWNVANVVTKEHFADGVGDGNKAPKFKEVTTNGCITRDNLNRAIQIGEDVTNINTSCITNMSNLFANNHSFNQDISSWDVSNVTNMDNMFKNASSFANHDLSGWNVANVVTKENFADGVGAGNRAPKFKKVTTTPTTTKCISIDALRKAVNDGDDVTKVNTSCITDMSYLFANNSSFNQDITSWDVSNVTNMDSMFKNAINFTNHDLSGWNVSNVVTKENFADGVGAGNRAPRFKKFITEEESVKLIQRAKDFCLGADNNGDLNYEVHCSDEKNIAYILINEYRNNYYIFISAKYKINMTPDNESIKVLNYYKKELASTNGRTIQHFTSALKNTPIYAIEKTYNEGWPEPMGNKTFYYRDKAVLTIGFSEYGNRPAGYNTSDNGKKLHINYNKEMNGPGMPKKCNENYDISNPAKPKLINKECTLMDIN